jgi:hypothetical protein
VDLNIEITAFLLENKEYYRFVGARSFSKPEALDHLCNSKKFVGFMETNLCVFIIFSIFYNLKN